jgi:DNA processing protein
MLAIVGTRQPTPYGARCAQEFSRSLAAAGFTVVSGLARGIDTLAHQAALEAGGRTIGILGSGVDVIYPPENGALADHIVERGALISELEMGSRPHAAHFPRRNRIISGMCIGTLVVETGPRGGAMITAAMALEQNREVFAIPSAVDLQRPSGTNLLIKRGEALLVERPEELMHELEPFLPALREHREAERTTGNAEPSSV